MGESYDGIRALADLFRIVKIPNSLLSFITNRSGEVIKMYDFPTLPPYDEA